MQPVIIPVNNVHLLLSSFYSYDLGQIIHSFQIAAARSEDTTNTQLLVVRNWITWGSTILISLGVLDWHTTSTSHLQTCIRITRGIIKTKTFDSFLERFFVIEGQSHLNPHQNYRWCDSLAN